MTIQALIFDFDGLIIDTEGPDWESWQAVYRAHGVELDLAVWQQCVGTVDAFDPCGHLETLVGRAVEREAIEAERWTRHVAQCRQQPILPGVLELLDAADAAGLKLAVASSSSRSWVGRWLDQHTLTGRFACIRTRDDVAHPKPAPDLYLSSAAGVNVAPEACVALEDSPHGMRAALAAGMRCVVVPTMVTADLAFEGAALRLGSLGELPLPALLERLLITPGAPPVRP